MKVLVIGSGARPRMARTISFSVDDGASANSHSNVATATVDVTVSAKEVTTLPAAAETTLTFDNLPSNGSAVPQGYGLHRL